LPTLSSRRRKLSIGRGGGVARLLGPKSAQPNTQGD
jgi:hypothetical protein